MVKKTATKTKTAKEKIRKAVSKAKLKVEEKFEKARSDEIEIQPKPAKTERIGPEKYYESIGRRKRAVARVRVFTKKSTDTQVPEDRALVNVNGKPYYEYFRVPELQNIIESPLKKLKSLGRFKATIKIGGGGIHGQADAAKSGLSRALVLFDQNFSKKLRKAGYLTRDPREKERRKYGLKKARKAPQWAKR